MKWHNDAPSIGTRVLARISHPDYSTSPFYYMVVRPKNNPDEVVEAGGEGYWSFDVNCVQAYVTEKEIEENFKRGYDNND